jgi:hypothetical protein
MGVDFNRIGFGISSGTSRTGFGTIVSNPSGGDFPPYGTFYETLVGVTYPIAEGGEFFVHPVDSTDFPNQVCDVDVYHNGSGGFYSDWSSVTNVAYVESGTIFWQDTVTVSTNPVEVPESSGIYYDSALAYPGYTHDGAGSYFSDLVNGFFIANGTEVSTDVRENYSTTEIPESSGNFVNNGKYDTYRWDGSGGFSLSSNQGSYYANGTLTGVSVNEQKEVPDGSGYMVNNNRYQNILWNGTGGITFSSTLGSYYPNGTFIYNDGMIDYYWDGNGEYYF